MIGGFGHAPERAVVPRSCGFRKAERAWCAQGPHSPLLSSLRGPGPRAVSSRAACLRRTVWLIDEGTTSEEPPQWVRSS